MKKRATKTTNTTSTAIDYRKNKTNNNIQNYNHDNDYDKKVHFDGTTTAITTTIERITTKKYDHTDHDYDTNNHHDYSNNDNHDYVKRKDHYDTTTISRTNVSKLSSSFLLYSCNVLII